MANYFWKIWLRENPLSKEANNEYIAEVLTEKNTLRNEDIAQRIIDEGSEIKYDTLLSICNQRDRIVRQSLLQGYSVLTQTCQFTPRVSGVWTSTHMPFDPEKHKITLDITPSAEMREALGKVGIKMLGKKEAAAEISLVTDTLTGKIDKTITAGDDMMIEGTRIKVTPEEEEGVGIFLISDAGEEVKVKRRLTQNDPSKIIARVPAGLEPGAYTLRIVTRFTSGDVPLKTPRTIEYEHKLTVN